MACTVTLDVGDPCGLVVVAEVMSANAYDEDESDAPWGSSDWIELENRVDTTVDLGGYMLVGHQEQQPAFVIPEGTSIAARASLLLVASTYRDDDEVLDTMFDLNNDSDVVLFFGTEAGGHPLCEEVQIPDLHWNHSWQRDPTEPERWCDAAWFTPGEANAPCLCDVSDDC